MAARHTPAGESRRTDARDDGAYQAVRHAPLRYHIEGHPRVAARAVETARPVRRETVPVSDHSEWLIRFLLGAAFGVVVNLLLRFAGVEVTPALWIAVPLAFGLVRLLRQRVLGLADRIDLVVRFPMTRSAAGGGALTRASWRAPRSS